MNIDPIEKHLLAILDITKQSSERARSYLNSRDPIIISSFTLTEKLIKKERSDADSLFAELAEDIELSDSHASELSRFICRADDEMNNTMTSLLLSIFNSYTEWRGRLTAFVDSCSLILSSIEDMKLGSLISEARALLAADIAFCEELEKTINAIKQ